MPDGYVLDIWVLISNFHDCMLQAMRKPLFVGVEVGPASIELVFAMGVLLLLVKVQDGLYCENLRETASYRR